MIPDRVIKQERRCTQASFYALCKWLEAKRAELIATRPQLHVVAAEAGKALNFDCAPDTVMRARKVAGVAWIAERGPYTKREHVNGDGNNPANVRVKAIAEIGRAVVSLYGQLGVDVPAELTAALAALR